MWPFKKKLGPKHYIERPGRILFETIPETSTARCIHCNRKITQKETDITFHSERDCVRASGAVWCNECQTIYRFDRRDREVEIRRKRTVQFL